MDRTSAFAGCLRRRLLEPIGGSDPDHTTPSAYVIASEAPHWRFVLCPSLSVPKNDSTRLFVTNRASAVASQSPFGDLELRLTLCVVSRSPILRSMAQIPTTRPPPPMPSPLKPPIGDSSSSPLFVSQETFSLSSL